MSRVLSILFVSVWVLLACLIVGPSAARPAPTEEPAVAVFDLENLSPDNPSAAGMGELLAGQVVDSLKESHRRVVERQQLVLALEELKIGSGDLADASTRLRIGKMVGANHMVFGSFMQLGGIVRLDLRLVDVETGRVLNASDRSTQSADPAEWMRLAREAAKTLY
jgi:curli biogenesis system outer membrane secretion channel CsgG